MTKGTANTVIAILLIVIGLLMAIGKLGLGDFLGYAGIILIALGILILIGKLPGGTMVGVACLVIGVLLVADFFPLPKAIGENLWILNLLLGVVLIILGVQRLR